MVKVALGSDHGGYLLKEELEDYLRELGYTPVDFGTHSAESVDYPDFGLLVAKEVAGGNFPLGILVCGTGIGMSLIANKVQGLGLPFVLIPYGPCSREHNHANILVLG